MTGTIIIFNAGSASGVIASEDGLRVHFETSAVMAYDANTLAAGLPVTFDLNRGLHPRAVNICVERLRGAAASGKAHQSMPIRYMGFQQDGNVRHYRFQKAAGDDKETFAVQADLALFAKHHVGIQEGPGLAMRLLVSAFGDMGSGTPLSGFALSDADLSFYVANLPHSGKGGARRMSSMPAALPALA